MTPSDLRAMRLRIGLKEEQLAELLGASTAARNIRSFEAAAQRTTWAGHREILEAIERQFDGALGATLERADRTLCGFPNDAALAEFAPAMAELLRRNSVHRMMLAVAQRVLADEGRIIPIVEVVPALYGAWLTEIGRAHSDAAMREWCTARLAAFREKSGMPPI